MDGSIDQNLSTDGFSQLNFLENFALDNAVMSVGAFNYTGKLGIPNVPLDASAFAETALPGNHSVDFQIGCHGSICRISEINNLVPV